MTTATLDPSSSERAARVARHNTALIRAGLTEKLVENSDYPTIRSFCSRIGLADKNVLDIGCSTGAVAASLAECDGWRSYRGIDVCPESVAAFESRRIPRASAQLGDATKLDVESASKDLVLLLFVLQHLTKPEGLAALCEAARVTRSGGVVYVGLTVHPAADVGQRMYAAELAKRAGAEEVMTSFWEQEELVSAVNSTGLEHESMASIPSNGGRRMVYLCARRASG